MRRIALMATFVIVAAPLLFCQSSQKSRALTNQDVISMVKNALPESVILGSIQNNKTDFDISASGLIALKRAGVSPNIMDAMISVSGNKKNRVTAPAHAAADNSAPTAVNAPPAAPAWQPVVHHVIGKKRISLSAEPTEIVNTKAKPTSLRALAADVALYQALQVGTEVAQNALTKTSSAGSTAFSSSNSVIGEIFARRKQQSQQQQKTTYVWALSGGSSTNVVAGGNAVFEVTYSGLPGVKPDQFEPVIVKLALTPQETFRLVGATVGATNAGQDANQDWPIYSSFVEDRVPAKVDRLGEGRARIIPATALAVGQYAVALRPVDKKHRFSGEEVARNQGEGLLFNYVWSFSVN